MTTDEAIARYRRAWLGFIAEGFACRRLPPSEYGMVMDKQLIALDALVIQMVNDIALNCPRPAASPSDNGVAKPLAPLARKP